jgi:hypothetical protein
MYRVVYLTTDAMPSSSRILIPAYLIRGKPASVANLHTPVLNWTLLAFVDDATSRLMQLACSRPFDYFRATRASLEAHGKPVAFYSDKRYFPGER